jgi:adenine-specific DNA methylase
MITVRARIKPYIQPFERTLALKELEQLSSGRPSALEEGWYAVRTAAEPRLLAERLSYWETVFHKRDLHTAQALVEATTNVVRNGISLDQIRSALPFKDAPAFVNRRALRYGTHGIHEYRGKFFPQLVKSLINIAGVPDGGVVLDPMCGSGTTLAEAVASGRRAYGLDMNPLSVLISRIKCDLQSIDPGELERSYEWVRSQLLAPGEPRLEYFSTLPDSDQAYLSAWIADYVLLDLDRIMAVICHVENPLIRDYFKIALSNVLRSVSWQKDADLRVRKEIRTDIDIDGIRTFLEELGRSVRMVLATLYQRRLSQAYQSQVAVGNACNASSLLPDLEGRVNAVITSPPYATALPYLDTDRLSLCYLGLLTRPEHRRRDQDMIGNREVTGTLRKEYVLRFESKGSNLGPDIPGLINRIHSLNETSNAGFRRRNLPALLAKYFFDMREVLTEIHTLLAPHGSAFVVIGDNHTIAGAERVDIPTADLLAGLATRVGFRLDGTIPMEMLTSRDIFKKNAVAAESILVLKKA